MKLFDFCWFWYEEEQHNYFTHPDKTEKEFRADCKSALIAVGPRYMEEEQGWVSLPQWIELASKELPKYGYIKVEPITSWYWGNYIIEEEETNDTAVLRQLVGEALVSMALSKNRIKSKELYGGLDG